MKTTAMQVTNSVEKEVYDAYADCSVEYENNFEGSLRIRNLDFRASLPVTVERAIEIFKNINPNFSYNEFTPNLLKKLGADTLVTIARESSPAVYVHTELRLSAKTVNGLRKKMLADEGSEESVKDGFNTYRFWWD